MQTATIFLAIILCPVLCFCAIISIKRYYAYYMRTTIIRIIRIMRIIFCAQSMVFYIIVLSWQLFLRMMSYVILRISIILPGHAHLRHHL